jgi:hypothetical protein
MFILLCKPGNLKILTEVVVVIVRRLDEILQSYRSCLKSPGSHESRLILSVIVRGLDIILIKLLVAIPEVVSITSDISNEYTKNSNNRSWSSIFHTFNSLQYAEDSQWFW